MRKIYTLLLSLMLIIGVGGTMEAEAQNWSRLLQAGLKGVQSLTISDSQIQNYVHQYITDLDSKSQVADSNSPYTRRLTKIVSGITEVDGVPLNFKVYITKDINAFACADGSVRVYSGLMDLMNDDEVLGVIGHEIGHVAHKDTRNAFKAALQTSALRDVISSAGGMVATLSDSQLGAIGETLLQKGYSRKQESNADTYAYYYLKSNGKNPLVMAQAFRKLNSVSGGGSNALMQAFSDHPDTQKRIENIEKFAKQDGFTYTQLQSQTTKAATDSVSKKSAASVSSKSSAGKSRSSKATKNTSKKTKKSTKKSNRR